MRMILNSEPLLLSELSPGDFAEITQFDHDDERSNFLQRLHEVGFLEGEKIEILHEAPLSRDPISIRIKDAVYALRREDANLIQVKKISKMIAG